MRKIKDVYKFYYIEKSINENRFNLILTPRGWGLTTFLINYINQIPNNKTVLFDVVTQSMNNSIKNRITHPNCVVNIINENKMVGRSFDYIICDNFFYGSWIKKLTLISPSLKVDGKIILGDSDMMISSDLLYFINYNKIIKTNMR